MSAIRILLLEDNSSDAELVQNALLKLETSYDYRQTVNRAEFHSTLKEYNPHIVLSDFALPGFHGLAAFLEMKERGFDLPFILVTGSLSDEIAVECMKAGIDDYILKDRLVRLPNAIKKAIEKKNLVKEKEEMLRSLVVSQKSLAEAQQIALLGNWELNVDTKQFVWSDQLYSILEIPKDTFTSSLDLFMATVVRHDRKLVNEALNKCILTQNTISFYYQIRTKSGKTKILHSICKPITGIAGQVLKVYGTTQDVTEAKQNEIALKDLTRELDNKVKERTRELSEANKTLNHRNHEITDSINYARRIQSAILHQPEEIEKYFPKSFVLWKPKDIISGDFYWHYVKNGYRYIAAIDCTGHGVPGALMSMIGNQLLANIIIENGLIEPAQVLTLLDEAIIRSLKQETGMVKDGMDIALCRIENEGSSLLFAGALRPLFFHNGESLEEIAGSKYPVGSYYLMDHPKEFSQVSIQLKPGNVIYLTSDGYYSQFGDSNGKKMMKRRFREVLASLNGMPMPQQRIALSNYFEEWKGPLEQVDNVLVVGIEL